MEITRDTLLTVGGIAFITAICIQLWVKPTISKWWADKPWHDIAVNGAATVLAIILAIAGLYVGLIPSDGPAIGFAVIQGIVGAFAAVYGYEAVKNVMKFVGKE